MRYTKKENLKNLSTNQIISFAFIQNSKKNSYQFIVSYQCPLYIGLQFVGSNICIVLLGHRWHQEKQLKCEYLISRGNQFTTMSLRNQSNKIRHLTHLSIHWNKRAKGILWWCVVKGLRSSWQAKEHQLFWLTLSTARNMLSMRKSPNIYFMIVLKRLDKLAF